MDMPKPAAHFNRIPRLRYVKDVTFTKSKAQLLQQENEADRLTYIDENNQKFNILEMDMKNQPAYLLRKVQALRQSQTRS
jgi:hypothetical protein